MTMICSSLDSGGRLTAISDVLTWVPGHIAPDVVGNVPLAGGPLRKREGSDAIARVEQKMVTFGHTMVLWSGELAVARTLLTRLCSETNNGSTYFKNFEEQIYTFGLTHDEMSHVSLIYHYHDAVRTRRHLHNTKTVEFNINDTVVAYEGSGSWNFLEDRQLYVYSPGQSGQSRMRTQWIGRMVTAIVDELIDQSTQDFRYGGWFEMSETRGAQIRKIPYALKFWIKAPQGLGNGPTMFSKYVDDHLCIFKLMPTANDGPPLDMCRVRDFLRRRDALQTPITWDAEFVVHLVLVEGQEGFKAVIENDPRAFRLEFGFDEDGRSHSKTIIGEGLVERLSENGTANPSYGTILIERPSRAE